MTPDACHCPPVSHRCEPDPPTPDYPSDADERRADARERFNYGGERFRESE